METRFYYLNESNEPVGPVDLEQMRKLRDAGIISESTLVCSEGESEWKPLKAILPVSEPDKQAGADLKEIFAKLLRPETFAWMPAVSLIAGIIAASMLWSNILFSFIMSISAVAIAAVALKQNTQTRKLPFRLAIGGVAVGGAVACLGLLGTAMSLGGGSKSREARSLSVKEEAQLVLENDRKLFEIAKKWYPKDSIALSIFLAKQKQQLDTIRCSSSFQTAFQNHVDAWKAAVPHVSAATPIVPYIEGHISGETRELKLLNEETDQALQEIIRTQVKMIIAADTRY